MAIGISPYEVLVQNQKHFTLNVKGHKEVISVVLLNFYLFL